MGNGTPPSLALSTVLDQEVELLLRDWLDPDQSVGIYWVIAQLVLFVAGRCRPVRDGSLPSPRSRLGAGSRLVADGCRRVPGLCFGQEPG